jgi:competence protein ComQ
LNKKTSEIIKESISSTIDKSIEINEIRDMLFEFVNFQSEKGFPFGELLILHYDFFGGEKTKEIYHVAAAVELIVLSFDILDDFEDEDSNNKPWWNNRKLALNATTNLLFLSIDILRKTTFKNKEKGVTILVEYALKSINGQYKDLLDNCQTEPEYIEMTIEKSGSLVALASLLGTVLATDEYPSFIKNYSEYIGLIAQIDNDIADIRGWDDKNDLINHKYSLPIIFLLNCQDEEVQIIKDYYKNKVTKAELLDNQELVNRKFRETGAIIYAETIKRLYKNRAMKEIQSISFNKLLKFIH